MTLKRYQERAIREVDLFLDKLAAHQASANAKYASMEAWEEAAKEFSIYGSYNPRK
jgi:hypothetical protein